MSLQNPPAAHPKNDPPPPPPLHHHHHHHDHPYQNQYRYQYQSLREAPSHILTDGQHVYLPPPSAAERAAFFATSVARYNLIRADDSDTVKKCKDREQAGLRAKGTSANASISTGSIHTSTGISTNTEDEPPPRNRNRNDEDDDDSDETGIGTIHPLAIASARLQSNGISELSKAINLANLVQGGEYFAFANVIEESSMVKNGGDVSVGVGVGSSVSVGVSSGSSSVQPTAAASEASTAAAAASTGSNAESAPSSTATDAAPPSNDATAPTPQSTSKSTPTTIPTTTTTTSSSLAEIEATLRASYILKRKRQQFASSSYTFRQHSKRLRVVTAAQQVTDGRYLELRKRWKLVPPEHGSVVAAPVRPNEVLAIDVDIYSHGSDGTGVSSSSSSSSMGKIARNVPRYATIELADDFDLVALREFQKRKRDETHSKNRTTATATAPTTTTTTTSTAPTATDTGPAHHDHRPKDTEPHPPKNPPSPSSQQVEEEEEETKMNTIAQPFTMADATTNPNSNLSEDQDLDIPMLTLLFQIEKSCTGFVHSVALSSSIQDSFKGDDDDDNDYGDIPTNNGQEDEKNVVGTTNNKENDIVISTIVRDKVNPKSDERVIQSLQHSLFCANVFDSIWREVASIPTLGSGGVGGGGGGAGYGYGSGSGGGGTNGHGRGHSNGNGSGNSNALWNALGIQNQQPVWLSSELEDNFLPPPSFMAGNIQQVHGKSNSSSSGGGGGGMYPTCPLSVIHCHEGEVKVQLDSEYALTVKLVDIRTDGTESASGNINYNGNYNGNAMNEDGIGNVNGHSGSESREQIDILCKLLQLHSQFVFHDHHTRSAKRNRMGNAAGDDGAEQGEDGAPKVVDYSTGMRGHIGGGSGAGGRSSASALALSRRKTMMVEESPNILQSCVALGANVLLERKVRNALKNLAKWQARNIPSLKLEVEWLPLSSFDSHSQFALAFDNTNCINVNISGGTMAVTSFTDDRGYRSVQFGWSQQFELFVKHEMRRIVRINNP